MFCQWPATCVHKCYHLSTRQAHVYTVMSYHYLVYHKYSLQQEEYSNQTSDLLLVVENEITITLPTCVLPSSFPVTDVRQMVEWCWKDWRGHQHLFSDSSQPRRALSPIKTHDGCGTNCNMLSSVCLFICLSDWHVGWEAGGAEEVKLQQHS